MSDGYKITKIGELPINWDIQPLSNLKEENSTISYGVVQPGPEDLNGILFIRGGDIKNGKISNKLRTISNAVSNEYKRTLIKGGELLISLVGYPGECAIAPFHLKGANIARQVGLIRVQESYDSNYLRYYLSSPSGKKNLLGNLVGSAQQVINLDLLRKVEIPIPPIQEQQKIAEILNTVDEKIDVIDLQIDQTQLLKNGLMKRLLTKGIGHTKFKDSPVGEIPESWEVMKLGSLVEKVGSGITPKGGQESYVKEGVIFLRSQNVLNGKLKLTDVAFISKEQHQKMAGSKLAPGDVLLNITGASIGRSAVVPESITEGNVNQHVCIVRTKNNLNSNFLCQLLNSNYGQNQIDKFQAGGNREGLNFQQIRSFDILFPKLIEQEKIASVLATVDKKLEALLNKKEIYKTLKEGLMQQLLTGQIRVNHINTNNAKTKSRSLQAVEER